MVYLLDDGQLFNLWTAIRYLGEVHEIPDAKDRAEVLTEAQILLTAFVLELTPLPGDQANAVKLRASRGQTTHFDA